METIIIFFRRLFLLALSLFNSRSQIQTRLQNLGSNLQNKSNDIEILAVSHLFVYPFIAPPQSQLPCSALQPYLLNSCVKSQSEQSAFDSSNSKHHWKQPFHSYLPCVKIPCWMSDGCESTPVATEQWTLNRRQRRVISRDVDGCYIEFICGCIVDLRPDILKVNQPCLSYLPCGHLFQIQLLGPGLHQCLTTNTNNWNKTSIITLIPVSSWPVSLCCWMSDCLSVSQTGTQHYSFSNDKPRRPFL